MTTYKEYHIEKQSNGLYQILDSNGSKLCDNMGNELVLTSIEEVKQYIDEYVF